MTNRQVEETYNAMLPLYRTQMIPESGWQGDPLPWTYLGSASFYIATADSGGLADLRNKYPVGLKLSWQDGGGTPKYGYVGSSTWPGGTNTVYLAPIPGYTFSGSAITDQAYSRILGPNDYPAMYRYASGAIFPPSPDNGQHFYRTDLGWWCYWNGTYWLTCNEYTLSIIDIVTSMTVSTTVPLGVLRSDYQFYATRINLMANLTAPQDASNYWTILPRVLNEAYSAAEFLAAKTTVGLSAGTQSIPVAITNPTDATKKYRVDMVYTKTGAAGAFALASANFCYRLIVT